MYRVLVTGARDLPEAETVWLPLWILLHQKQSIIVSHGANPAGADLYAHEWFELPEQTFNRKRRAHERKVEYLAIEDPHPPDYNKGSYAPNIRNQDMVNLEPSAVFAFPTPKSQGTLDAMARAWVRDIDVWIWHYLQIGSHRKMTDIEGERLARNKLGWGNG